MTHITTRLLIALTAFTLGVAAFLLVKGVHKADQELTSALLSGSNKPADDSKVEEETVAVYRVLVASDKPEVVIRSKTYGPIMMLEDEEHLKQAPDIYARFELEVTGMFPTADKEMLRDYFVKNKEPQELKATLDLGVKYFLLKDKESDKRSAGRERKGFSAKYPKANSILTLSRVGFNQDRTKAFVYTGRFCSALCGSGDYILLKKQDGVWVIEKEFNLWVS